MEMHTGTPLFEGKDEGDQVTKQVSILGMPPVEMLKGGRKVRKHFVYDAEADTWSLKPKLLSRLHSNRSIRRALGKNWVDNAQYRQFEDLIMQMLQYNPKDRIRPKQALQHPFFRGVSSSSSASKPSKPSKPSSSSHSKSTQRRMLAEAFAAATLEPGKIARPSSHPTVLCKVPVRSTQEEKQHESTGVSFGTQTSPRGSPIG
jgi:dual specificity tyrosine-phosphorylation-regulated kinase 1